MSRRHEQLPKQDINMAIQLTKRCSIPFTIKENIN